MHISSQEEIHVECSSVISAFDIEKQNSTNLLINTTAKQEHMCIYYLRICETRDLGGEIERWVRVIWEERKWVCNGFGQKGVGLCDLYI